MSAIIEIWLWLSALVSVVVVVLSALASVVVVGALVLPRGREVPQRGRS